MRRLIATLFFAALAAPAAALAGPVAVAPVTVSEDFAKALAEDYGPREQEELNDAIVAALTRELTRKGGEVVDGEAPLTIAVVIEDAKPNRPTFKQLGDRPGLDFIRSFSLGGAHLKATITTADGTVRDTVDYSWYDTDIRNAATSTTWTDARRAIGWFARRVGEAYAAADGAGP